MRNRLPIAFTLVAILASQSADATTLSIAPASASGTVGDVLTFDLVAADLAGGVVGGYAFEIGFDPAILPPSSVVYGPALGDPLLEQIAFPDPALPPAAPGTLALSAVSL